MQISGKVIVITGAAKGLGKVLTEILETKGAAVVTSDISGDVDCAADVTKESDMDNLAAYAQKTHGRIDVWVNNAGVWLPPTDITKLDIQKVRTLFDVNVFGTLLGTRAAASVMKQQQSGTIVTICSTTAFDGLAGSSGSAYVASKYAIRGFINAIRPELAHRGIKLIGVYPGGFKSELFKENIPAAFDSFMTVECVAEKIVENLEQEKPSEQLIIPRPGQKMPEHLF